MTISLSLADRACKMMHIGTCPDWPSPRLWHLKSRKSSLLLPQEGMVGCGSVGYSIFAFKILSSRHGMFVDGWGSGSPTIPRCIAVVAGWGEIRELVRVSVNEGEVLIGVPVFIIVMITVSKSVSGLMFAVGVMLLLLQIQLVLFFWFPWSVWWVWWLKREWDFVQNSGTKTEVLSPQRVVYSIYQYSLQYCTGEGTPYVRFTHVSVM
jgi:hypothetical protein